MFDLTEEQLMMRGTIQKITQEKIAPRAAEIDETDEYPKDLEEVLRENGILKLLIPELYGGLDGDITTACIIVEEINRASGAVSMIAYVCYATTLLMAHANDRQKEKYLAVLA